MPKPRVEADSSRNEHPALWVFGTILVCLIMLGSAMWFYDPNLNFPVISQAVCSLKGDTWYGGGLLGPPGCYASSQPP